MLNMRDFAAGYGERRVDQDPSAATTSKSPGRRSMSSNRSRKRKSAAMPLIRQIRRTSSILSAMMSEKSPARPSQRR